MMKHALFVVMLLMGCGQELKIQQNRHCQKSNTVLRCSPKPPLFELSDKECREVQNKAYDEGLISKEEYEELKSQKAVMYFFDNSGFMDIVFCKKPVGEGM